jgi:hypothetical protein
VLALAAANALGAVLFGTLYVVAGLRYLSQAAFLGCLAVLFVLVTAMWVRLEAHHGHLNLVSRLGKVAAGLAAAAISVPIAVLMPLFWLDGQLPAEAGLRAQRGAVMVIVLIALVLTTLVNVAGGIVIGVRSVRRKR